MSDEAVIYWDKLISQFGHQSGQSRHIVKDILRGPGDWVALGAEYQPPDANYRWKGTERETGEKGRSLVFQWTVEGEGVLQVGDRCYPQTPGTAFAVQLPSDHEYWIVPTGPGWKFFYIRIDDPWVAERHCEAAKETECSFSLSTSTRLAIETLHFFQQAYRGELQDPFDADSATLAWTVELRRHIFSFLHPHDRRMEILESAQAFYRKNRNRSFGVEEFSASIGMTRVRASISFHKLTGKTLAAYFLELRLRDAVSMLGQGRLKLQYIAQETGFSDANHLCKSFRRAYQTTPGQFRKLLGETSKG